MKDSKEKSAELKAISKGNVEWVLTTVFNLPKFWLIASTIFIILSMFNVSWTPPKEASATFQVTGTTAIFLALLWLPSLLRVFALAGGGIKTPAGEINTGKGMSELLALLKQDTLGILISETATAEERAAPGEKAKAGEFRQQLETAYISRIPVGQRNNELTQLVEQYKQIRASMPYGGERTFQMESLVGRMRAIISQTKLLPNEVDAYLHSDDIGERLLGLACVQLNGDGQHFEQVAQIIDNPKSAFEQYQALRAVLETISRLNKSQRQTLSEILTKQQNYNRDKGQWIKRGTDRYWLSNRILNRL